MAESTTPATPAPPPGESPGVQVRETDAPYTGAVPVTQPTGAEGRPPQGGDFFSSPVVWIMLAALVAFTLFGNRGRKKQMAEMERLKTLKKGDRVVTIGMIHGTVTALTDDTMTLKVDEQGHSLVFDRRGLRQILPRPGETEEEAGGKPA